LAYSPAAPPAKDYFFQYSWILPGIFDPNTNLREHRYFGSYFKGSAKFLFDFWASARNGCGAALQQYCEPGLFSDIEVKTPLAAYHHVRKYYNTAGFMLIQHGSYQWISREDQPRSWASRSRRCRSSARSSRRSTSRKWICCVFRKRTRTAPTSWTSARPVSELKMQIREDANPHLAPYSPSTDHSRPFGSNSMATRFPGQATLFKPMQGTPDTTASIRAW
jgi:hypothetical protein